MLVLIISVIESQTITLAKQLILKYQVDVN